MPLDTIPHEPEQTQLVGHPIHIKLPLDLRDPSMDIDGPDVERALKEVFPDLRGYGEFADRAYITIQVERLPSSPWPMTVGGVACVLFDCNGNGNNRLIPLAMAGNVQTSICMELERSAPDSRQAFRLYADAITDAFTTLFPDVAVMEFIVTSNAYIYIVLADQVDVCAIVSSLSGRVADRMAMYINGKDLGRPTSDSQQAGTYHTIAPDVAEQIVDDTAHDVLRPGMLLSSFVDKTHKFYNLITSGVAVCNSVGDVFITTACHGIGAETTVYAGRPSLNVTPPIGKAVVEVSFTDVALVALEPQVQFHNELLVEHPRVVTRLAGLLGENADGDELRMGDVVTMNSPFTGPISGSIQCKGWKLSSEGRQHATKKKHRYIVYDWSYMGQQPTEFAHKLTIPDSTCGSAIVDVQGRVTGFFRFVVKEGLMSGFYASVSADEVVRAGYKLASP